MSQALLPTAVLVDRRTLKYLFSALKDEFTAAPNFGFDIETEDSKRHEGLNQFMKIADPEEGEKNQKLVFDYNRATITGFSVYPRDSRYTYYFNLGHSDIENRLTLQEVRPLLDIICGSDKHLFVHNGPFEITMLQQVWGIPLTNVICTLQLAVSCFNPDEYNRESLIRLNLAEKLAPLCSDITKYFTNFDGKKSINPAQAKVVQQVIGKQSKAAYSYNGIVGDISYGYGLKKIVKSLFGYQMATFEDTLAGRAHMGQLSGDEVVSYGCDDAFWVVPLFDALIQYMTETNPELVPIFFSQENPMIYQYANVTKRGIRVNAKAIEEALHEERQNYYDTLVSLKENLRNLLPDNWVESDIVQAFANAEKDWYSKGYTKLRARLAQWILSDTSEDPYTEVIKINGAVSEPWFMDKNPRGKKLKTLSLTHYYQVRVILYDMLGFKPVVGRKRVVESDGPARNLLGESCEKTDPRLKVLAGIADLASIEQRIKLYINPYKMLMDPETNRMYPTLNSQLATRRMAGQNPNLMQLSKSGAGAYVRGFFEPDGEEDVIVSIDWSQVELVLVGDQSQDPEFHRCYSSLPYNDLHKVAMSTCYFVEEAVFDEIRKLPDDVTEYQGLVFKDKNGVPVTPKEFYKIARKDVGKVSNFNYWYSGALASVGEIMGWDADTMWAATDAYRSRFHVAEEWRTGIQDEVSRFGFVTLPDHHRRVRFEATNAWYTIMEDKLRAMGPAFENFGKAILGDIQRRARNQAVNAMIQGTSATLAKRSILRMDQLLGDHRARFMQPIHDELVYNVHRDCAVAFIHDLKSVMTDHKDIVTTLPLDATAAVGLNFRSFGKQNPIGQFELDEANECAFIDETKWGKKLEDADKNLVITNLFKNREELYGY